MSNSIKLPQGDYNPPRFLKDLKTKSEDHWTKRGEKMALNLFHQMAKRVPAYKDFLSKNNINPDKIKTIDDFKKVPTIDKDNYLKAYPRQMLCWDGDFKTKKWVISTTSGSTGEPFYFPRQAEQDLQYALTAELYLLTNFNIDKKSTLYINGFAMGAWIGGLFTYQAIKYVADRGNYCLSIINPGIFKKEIIKAVKNLGDDFDQIIIGGYPPMIKDTIDEGIKEGLDWKKYNLKFVFSAESFSEKFRDYIIKKTGLADSYKDTLNHYGTVDQGTIAHETPLSILVRRLAVNNEVLAKKIFGQDIKLPTFAQFMPELFFFEEVDNNLFCSTYSGIPLVRYDLKDSGGMITLNQLSVLSKDTGIDLREEIKKASIADTVMNLPFVYVYERSDFTVKLYGANIYPETIKKILNKEEFEDLYTGKFTMEVKFNKNQDPFLEINIELKPGVGEKNGRDKDIEDAIITGLLKENSEYRSNYKESPQKQRPKVVFWSYEHPSYFMSGGKQKWVKK